MLLASVVGLMVVYDGDEALKLVHHLLMVAPALLGISGPHEGSHPLKDLLGLPLEQVGYQAHVVLQEAAVFDLLL